MIHFARKVWAVCVALSLEAGCVPAAAPATPTKEPRATCAEYCATTERLACSWYAPTCTGDCEAASAELRSIGSATLNTDCGAAATSCDEQLACRGGE